MLLQMKHPETLFSQILRTALALVFLLPLALAFELVWRYHRVCEKIVEKLVPI